MRVTINGLTDSTITFNTIGIILRGNSSKPELYPNSIARHIEINNEAQMRELVTLKNAKLISVIDESIVQVPAQPAQSECKAPKNDKPLEVKSTVVHTYQKCDKPVNSTSSETNIVMVEEIEDMPTSSKNIVDEDSLVIPSKKSVKKMGRPKKTDKKEKTTKTKTAKKEKDVIVKTIKPIKPVKRSNKFTVPKELSKEEDSKIVVMTPNGPIESKSINNMAGEIQESEATRASIEALKQMEEEESVPESLVDESKLDISQRMGTAAFVATGENNITKVNMKNSILPESDVIKNRGVKFIDPTGDNNPVDESDLDESIKNIFIDNQDSDDSDDSDDSFIEI